MNLEASREREADMGRNEGRDEQLGLTLLTVHEGGKQPVGHQAGQDLLEDVFDLIRRRLPALAVDDPVRIRLAKILPLLGRHLGRAPLMPVPEDRAAAR